MSLTGLDISRYQATTPALANYAFVFIRATYGLAVDAMYARHMAAARTAGIVAGSYHFGYGSGVASPEAQARMYLVVAAASDLLVLDLEASAQPMTTSEARAFIAAIHAAGRRIGLYHSESGFPELGQDWNWIASWDRTTFPPGALFWQYRGSPVDLDKFNGDANALRGLVAGSHMEVDMIPAPITDEAQKLVTVADAAAWYDLDGTTVLGHSAAALAARPSPYGVGSKRAIYATVGGTRRIVLVKPATVTAVPPPVVDCSDVVNRELEAAATRASDAVRNRA